MQYLHAKCSLQNLYWHVSTREFLTSIFKANLISSSFIGIFTASTAWGKKKNWECLTKRHSQQNTLTA